MQNMPRVNDLDMSDAPVDVRDIMRWSVPQPWPTPSSIAWSTTPTASS
jgi:hypothetical protein